MCQNGWFRDASTAKSRDRLGVRALSNRRFSLLCFHNVYTDGRRYKLKNQPPRNESLQRLPVVVSRCSIAFVVEARAHKRITIRYSAAFHRSRCRTLLVSRDDRTTHDDNIYKGGTVTSKPKLLRSVICHVLLRKIASFITTYVSTDRDNASLLKRDTETSSALTHTHTRFFLVFRCKPRRRDPSRVCPLSSQPLQLFHDPQFVFLTCPDTFQPPLSFPYRREERIIWHRDDCDDDEAFRLAPKFARLSLPFSLPLSIFSQRVRIDVTTKFG